MAEDGPPEYVPGEDPNDDGFQPPPDLDNLHAPDHVTVTCATCGGRHTAYLERYTPLGAETRDDDPKVQLVYRVPECTADNTGPVEVPSSVGMLGTPHVWHDQEDGT